MENYRKTNKLGVRGYVRRAFLIFAILGIIGIFLGINRFTQEKKIKNILHSERTEEAIVSIGENTFKEDQYIEISKNGIISEPKKINFVEDDQNFIGVDQDQDCANFMNKDVKGFLLAKDGVCISQNKFKKSMIGRGDIHIAKKENGPTVAKFIGDKYPTISEMFLEEKIILNREKVKKISQEAIVFLKSEASTKAIRKNISEIKNTVIITLSVLWLILSIILIPLVIIFPVLILASLAWIMGIIGQKKWNFECRFNRMRITSTIIILMIIFIPQIYTLIRLLIWAIFPIMDILNDKNK